MDSNDKYIGMFLDNRYEILERIGTGGMALVYKARCHRLNRLVAIKILKEELANDEEFRRRFHTESQAVAMLSHPNIVAVYDVSRSDNTEYIVMELIEGITLKQYINRKGLLSWKEALHFVIQIAKALGHAHSRGIIHRDIKPHNIMILKDGSVKVADFGIARLLSMQNTLTQEALGSVHYISPEQAKGGHVDARSDIYSVGVVMYEMLTSHLPFEGDSAVSIAIQHISAIPLMPRDINPDVPIGLESITMHAMEPNLNTRYTTVDELLIDLEEFRKNPSINFTYTFSDLGGVVEDHSDSTRPIPSLVTIKPERKQPVVRTAKPVRKVEISREEYRQSHRKAGRTATMIGVFSIIIFLVVVLIFMWNYLLKDIFNPPKETVIVPSFVGMKYSDVSTDPQYTQFYNFKIVGYEASEKYTEDYIIRQERPAAKREQLLPPDGIDVELIVSTGTEKPITMPALINVDYRVAKNQLENLGLGLVIELQATTHDSVTDGYIIETVPVEGAALTKGNTIYIKYSTGPERKLVKVPNLKGLKLDEAIRQLETAELTYDAQYFDDEAEKDTVIFQNKVDVEVEPHTEIRIHVSKGPAEKPPTQTPTYPTQPTDPTTPPTYGPPHVEPSNNYEQSTGGVGDQDDDDSGNP